MSFVDRTSYVLLLKLKHPTAADCFSTFWKLCDFVNSHIFHSLEFFIHGCQPFVSVRSLHSLFIGCQGDPHVVVGDKRVVALVAPYGDVSLFLNDYVGHCFGYGIVFLDWPEVVDFLWNIPLLNLGAPSL